MDPVDHKREEHLEQQLLQPVLLAGLATVADRLAGSAQALIKAANLNRGIRAALIIGMVLIVGLMGVVAVGVLELQKTAAANKDNTAVIKDCTQPSGTCYKHNQEATANAVGNINTIVVAAAYCARLPENDTQAEVKNCVQKIVLTK